MPTATPKGHTTGGILPIVVTCADNSGYDSCMVYVASGLTTGINYSLEVTDGCIGIPGRNVTAVAGAIDVIVNIVDCTSATFSLFTTGKRGGGVLIATSGLVLLP